jgi:hypothetical protein
VQISLDVLRRAAINLVYTTQDHRVVYPRRCMASLITLIQNLSKVIIIIIINVSEFTHPHFNLPILTQKLFDSRNICNSSGSHFISECTSTISFSSLPINRINALADINHVVRLFYHLIQPQQLQQERNDGLVGL